jgi:hypothetical protein
MKEGGVDKPMYMSTFLCISVAGFVGDGAHIYIRGWLHEKLQLGPEDADGTIPPPIGPGGEKGYGGTVAPA